MEDFTKRFAGGSISKEEYGERKAVLERTVRNEFSIDCNLKPDLNLWTIL